MVLPDPDQPYTFLSVLTFFVKRTFLNFTIKHNNGYLNIVCTFSKMLKHVLFYINYGISKIIYYKTCNCLYLYHWVIEYRVVKFLTYILPLQILFLIVNKNEKISVWRLRTCVQNIKNISGYGFKVMALETLRISFVFTLGIDNFVLLVFCFYILWGFKMCFRSRKN